VEALDRFLTQQAGQNRRRGFGQTFVLVDAADPARILGYYTLAPAQVEGSPSSPVMPPRFPPTRFPASAWAAWRWI
jgi:hypothetical protein